MPNSTINENSGSPVHLNALWLQAIELSTVRITPNYVAPTALNPHTVDSALLLAEPRLAVAYAKLLNLFHVVNADGPVGMLYRRLLCSTI